MALVSGPTTVGDAFFQPLHGLVAASPHTRPCPELGDESWLRSGVARVLEAVGSGRGFLQEHGPRFADTPGRTNYFHSLASTRRRDLAIGVNLALVARTASLPDRLAEIPELAKYECFAVDGHWHKAAAHDARHEEVKMAVGHFFSLDLRGHQLRHLALRVTLTHEHDMSVLERLNPKGLRQGVPKGRRVLIVYDKAAIGFAFWARCRRACAVYFVSRVKEGMVYDLIVRREVDPEDDRNRGVTEDRSVTTREGHPMRIICYTEPVSGGTYEFLTNEMDLPPGVVAELYRRRWDVEKTFDGIKNKLGQKKAWATSLVAKAFQGQMVAITHNLLLLYENRLESHHGVVNTSEDRRREQRTARFLDFAAAAGRPVSSLLLIARRATQRSVKFVRWLRHAIRDDLAEVVAAHRLAHLYATL